MSVSTIIGAKSPISCIINNNSQFPLNRVDGTLPEQHNTSSKTDCTSVSTSIWKAGFPLEMKWNEKWYESDVKEGTQTELYFSVSLDFCYSFRRFFLKTSSQVFFSNAFDWFNILYCIIHNTVFSPFPNVFRCLLILRIGVLFCHVACQTIGYINVPIVSFFNHRNILKHFSKNICLT